MYYVDEDLENGSFKIRDLKRENPSFVVNATNLKQVEVRHEINIHMHDNTISTSQIIPEDNLLKEGGEQESENEESDPYFQIHQIIGQRTKIYFTIPWSRHSPDYYLVSILSLYPVQTSSCKLFGIQRHGFTDL